MKYKQAGRFFEIINDPNSSSHDTSMTVIVCKLSHNSDSHEPVMFFWLNDERDLIEAAIPIKQHNNPMSIRFKDWAFLSEKVGQLPSQLYNTINGKVGRNTYSDDNWLTLYSNTNKI